MAALLRSAAALGLALVAILWAAGSVAAGRAEEPLTLLKVRCVQCHGPARQEGGLNLALPTSIARGGKSGSAVSPGNLAGSRLWQRVASGQMPPGSPLRADERAVLSRWIRAGAPGLPRGRVPVAAGDEHWAFRPLQKVHPPAPLGSRDALPIDRFVEAELRRVGLSLGPEAPRRTLIRRVSFDLTGLPPTPDQIQAYLADSSPNSYERMVERYLQSPHYGERWGKHWLDAAGYADSNGYFSADTDRPLAYRYRDYVIRSINADKPWDRFIREQLAGDEMAGYRPKEGVRPEAVELLTATHFLRNSPDGTDSSDGNPDEQRADKYAVLEGTLQIMGSSLLGVTVQCARCHDHKFEPFKQADYYALQAVIYPAFHVEKWIKPAQRVIDAATPEEAAAWKAASDDVDRKIAAIRLSLQQWLWEHREPGSLLFEAAFDASESLERDWSNSAPGDAAPAGSPPIVLGSAAAPGARAEGGRLRIIESGSPGDRALSTRRSFDWTPDTPGAWVQVGFDLLPTPNPAPYVGYFIALKDFNDTTDRIGGNVLLDGAAAGKAAIHLDYPGRDSSGKGSIGRSGYTAGHRYGVRVTNIGGGRFELSQLVDDVPEEGRITLTAADLPDGGFGFEYCCGRSFDVDNVRIEAGAPAADPEGLRRQQERVRRQQEAEREVKAAEAGRPPQPGKLAVVTAMSAETPVVHLLERGEYKRPGAVVQPGPPGFLRQGPATPGPARLAFAEWLTTPGSRAAALLARVTVNRWWGHHFGTGLAPNPDNLGYSGGSPSHPDLLEYLAGRLTATGWSARAVHREILLSRVYRQAATVGVKALRLDPDNRLLSRFPLRRLDAEAVRDAMLAVTGELDTAMGGPYVPTQRASDGDVIVNPDAPGARRRSVYLQQRRTQVHGLLEVFDAPSIVTNCSSRTSTTVPLQSLALLNSPFSLSRAQGLAKRLRQEAGSDADRLTRAFELVTGRPPTAAERTTAMSFLTEPAPAERDAAWVALCQMLLASNQFLYVE